MHRDVNCTGHLKKASVRMQVAANSLSTMFRNAILHMRAIRAHTRYRRKFFTAPPTFLTSRRNVS